VRVVVDDTGRFVPITDRPNRGLGLQLTEQLASEVEITTRERGTTVALEKELPEGGGRLEDPDEKQDDHD
jgi:anti-sigma regulatory factor (Ser/Thr protein kinase)